MRSFAAGKRRRVDADCDRQAGLIDADDLKRLWVFQAGDGLADGDVGHAGDGDDLAGASFGGLNTLKRFGHEQLYDLRLFDAAVAATPGHHLSVVDGAVHDAAEGQPADVGGCVQVGDQRLEAVFGIVSWRRDSREQSLEKGAQVRAGLLRFERGEAVAGVAVDDGKVELFLVRVQFQEELVDLVNNILDAAVGAVDLVDDQDHGQTRFEGLS